MEGCAKCRHTRGRRRRQAGSCPSPKPACTLRAGRLAPPPRIDRNIDVRRGTNPQAKRTSSACARLIWGTDTGTGSQATMSTDPRQDRKVDSLAGIRQSSSHGRVTHRYLRGQLASRVRALVLAGSNSRSRVARRNSRVSSTRRVSRAQKSAAPKNGALPRTTTGVNQIRPES